MLLFDFLFILHFSISSLFNVFLLSVSSFLRCFPPNNQENHDSKKIPLKYDVNTTLLKSSVNWEKNIDFRLCLVALYVKAFGPYPKHPGISYYMCNALKAPLIRKFVTNFCFAVVLIALNGFLFSLTKLLFKVYISPIKK